MLRPKKNLGGAKLKGIHVKNLTRKYNNNRGVININFSVGQGEIFGLLGPNGAGKTTTLKLVTGLLSYKQGAIYVNGSSLGNEYEVYMRQIGCIIGDVRLYPYLNARQHLGLVKNYYPAITADRITEVLTSVGLAEFASEKVGQYSTGIKQRLAFAMAIVHKPQVLLLDEPFRGMDIEGKSMMRSQIKHLAEREGLAIIVSSHLVHDIEDIASTVAVMNRGQIIKIIPKQAALQSQGTLENYFLNLLQEGEASNVNLNSSCSK